MRIEMKLLSDTIFGNGVSIPGDEDVSVLCDDFGFPYYKGSTFKGVFRDEYENYLYVIGLTPDEIAEELRELFGEAGSDEDNDRKLRFTDFTLSDRVKSAVLEEVGEDASKVTEVFTHTRVFTRIDENGMVQKGSLRKARCVDKGLCFYGEINCAEKDKERVKEALGFVKFIGTMRNRGFGKIVLNEEDAS